MKEMRVIKKNGTKEAFDAEKIKNISKRAGTFHLKANLLGDKVEKQLYEITSSKLRDIIYKALKEIDKEAARRYRKYYIENDY